MNKLNLSLNDTNVAALATALRNVPGVKVVASSLYILGGADKASIGISVYFNTSEECASGILMNGAHRKFMLHHDGELVELTGYKCKRFRKCNVKSVEAAILKLTTWAAGALEVA